MNATIRTYLYPIIITILMVAAMGLWAWQRWQSELEHYNDRLFRHASGVFDTIQSTIQALEQSDSLKRNQIEGILENVTRLSHLLFIVLEKDGNRILQVGKAPPTLLLNSGEGKSLSGRDLLLWKSIHLKMEKEGHGKENTDTSILRSGDGEQVMILGFQIPRESRSLAAAKKSIALTLVAALFFFISQPYCLDDGDPGPPACRTA